MYSTFTLLVQLASGLLATTYGHGEKMCGDVGAPRACAVGAVTASGEDFDPSIPSAALAAPYSLRMSATWAWLKLEGPYPCRKIRLNDKSNPRWIGRRGFDLSPAAVRKLTGRRAHRAWSGRVQVCAVE